MGIPHGHFEQSRPATSLKPQEKAEYYARYWFSAMARFHRVQNPENWEFSEEDLIAFLRSKLKTNVPAWKRLKIVEGVIWYRDNVRKSSVPRLERVRAKLQQIAAQEVGRDSATIEDVVGKINPREPDVIQELRRKLRTQRRALNTEKAYVQKIRAFMLHRGLKCLDDFNTIGAADVEAHLTDLAVDGDVARSRPHRNS